VIKPAVITSTTPVDASTLTNEATESLETFNKKEQIILAKIFHDYISPEIRTNNTNNNIHAINQYKFEKFKNQTELDITIVFSEYLYHDTNNNIMKRINDNYDSDSKKIIIYNFNKQFNVFDKYDEDTNKVYYDFYLDKIDEYKNFYYLYDFQNDFDFFIKYFRNSMKYQSQKTKLKKLELLINNENYSRDTIDNYSELINKYNDHVKKNILINEYYIIFKIDVSDNIQTGLRSKYSNIYFYDPNKLIINNTINLEIWTYSAVINPTIHVVKASKPVVHVVKASEYITTHIFNLANNEITTHIFDLANNEITTHIFDLANNNKKASVLQDQEESDNSVANSVANPVSYINDLPPVSEDELNKPYHFKIPS